MRKGGNPGAGTVLICRRSCGGRTARLELVVDQRGSLQCARVEERARKKGRCSFREGLGEKCSYVRKVLYSSPEKNRWLGRGNKWQKKWGQRGASGTRNSQRNGVSWTRETGRKPAQNQTPFSASFREECYFAYIKRGFLWREIKWKKRGGRRHWGEMGCKKYHSSEEGPRV